MWRNLLKLFKYLLLLEQIIFQIINFKVSAIQERKCVGKHQMELDVVTDLVYEPLEPIEFINFDKTPIKTIIVNNGHSLRIDLDLNDSVPMIKIDFESSLAVKGIYRLEFLYFHRFTEVPVSLAYENLTFPAELHLLFFDVNSRSLTHAFNKNNSVVMLAFGIKVDPLEETGFDLLQGNLNLVSETDDITSIENRNLQYWLRSDMQRFYVYEGSFYEFNCGSSLIWIDFVDVLSIKPELIKEFGQLKENDFNSQIEEATEILKPQGRVYKNFPSALASAPLPPLAQIETSGVEMTRKFQIKKIIALIILMQCFSKA